MGAPGAWLNPDVDHLWSDDPRAGSAALLTRVLTERVGVVLVGTQEDRLSVVRESIEPLRAEHPVHHLHGSEFVTGLPYGALSILQARSEIGPGGTWHRTTRLLGEYLSPADGDRAVVLLSRPELMDHESVTVLAQLAHQRRVTLVVQCDRLRDLPADLAALTRSGHLRNVTIRPLSPTGTRSLLASHLGGRVSRVAATVLWHHSGGHVGRLRELADDCVAVGKLRETAGQWVLADGPVPPGRDTVAEDVALRRLPADRRALVEMLAVRGPTDVGELVGEGHGADLDALQALGIVRIRPTSSGRTATVQPVWRDRVLGTIQPDRRRELDLWAESRDGLRRMLLRAEESFVVADVAGVLKMLGPVRAGDRDHGTDAPDPVRLHLVWLKARALAARGDLTAASELADGAPDVTDPCLLVLSADLAASRGDLPAARRWLAATADAYAGARPEAGGPGENRETVVLRAEATRAEVLALGEDQDGALDAADRVVEAMAVYHQRGVLDLVMSPYDRASIALSLVRAHLSRGDLDACRELAEAILLHRHGNAHAVLHAELAVVAVDLLAGRLDRADAAARDLVGQCRACGDTHALDVARALATCAGALRDRGTGRAGQHPDAQDDETGTYGPAHWGSLGWFGALVDAFAPRPGRPRERRSVRLGAVAERARAEGMDVVELNALLWMVLLGVSSAADRLRAVATRTRSALSGPAEQLATALVDDDPVGICAGLTGLTEAGLLLWRHGGLAPLAERLRPADARRLAEAVARLRLPHTDAEPERDPGWMRGLTKREREIARLVVGGMTNAGVARHHGISVRTVEGHLNQIYAKVRARGRSDLARLAASSRIGTMG